MQTFIFLFSFLALNDPAVTSNNSFLISELEQGDDPMALLLNYLQRTEEDLLTTMDTMNVKIHDYAPVTGAWNAKQIMEHIIMAEQSLFTRIKQAMEETPGEGEDLSANDAWLIGKVNDRGVKVKTPLPAPETDKSWEELKKEFIASRLQISQFLEQPNLQLRSHYGKSIYGKSDCYQLFLIIAAHGMRHHHQLLENINHFYEN